MKVVLYGGPRDGETFDFAHGDIVELPAGPPSLDFSVQTVDPVRYEKHTYRRSLRSPHIFVFQP